MSQVQEEARNKQHDRHGRHADGKGGNERPQDAVTDPSGLHADRVADIGGRVDGNRSGGNLRHGHNIGKLATRHPAVAGDHLVLDQRQHGVAASKTEEADLKIGEEELPKDHCFNFLRCESSQAIPPTAAAISR